MRTGARSIRTFLPRACSRPPETQRSMWRACWITDAEIPSIQVAFLWRRGCRRIWLLVCAVLLAVVILSMVLTWLMGSWRSNWVRQSLSGGTWWVDGWKLTELVVSEKKPEASLHSLEYADGFERYGLIGLSLLIFMRIYRVHHHDLFDRGTFL